MPNYYVSRRSTEAQGFSVWTPPGGTLGELTDEARARAATLTTRAAELERAAGKAATVPPFASALRRTDVAVIAEVKRSSPSKGLINSAIDTTEQATAYQQGGASAISILTEASRFGGSNDDLTRARAAVRLPLLKKDFHVDVVQIWEAKTLGASAVLLIARAVEPGVLRQLHDAAKNVGLEALVEVRDQRELERALSFGARVIGVNNRNLETLEVDPETCSRLIPLIPRDVIAVAESGIRSAADVERLAGVGADAVLVGSQLSAADDPENAVRSLTNVARTLGARKS